MIRPSIKGVGLLYGLTTLFGILMVVANILEPVIYGRIIDEITRSVSDRVSAASAFQAIVPLLIVWAGLFIAGAVSSGLRMYLSWIAGNRVINNFASKIYERILRLGIRWHNDSKPGDLMRRFDRAWNGLWQLQLVIFRSLIPSTLTFVLVLVIGFWLNWKLTVVALIPVPIAFLIGFISFKRLEKRQKKINKSWEKIFTHVNDHIVNILSIKTTTSEERSQKTMRQYLRQALRRQLAINKWWALTEAGQDSLTVAARLLIFSFGVYFVIAGEISLGVLITFLGFANFIYLPLQTILAHEIPNLTEWYTGVKRIAVWWYKIPEIEERPDPIKLKNVQGDIEFNNVTFAYKKEPAIKNVSFRVPAGTTAALVGESGSGKTTIAMLINRLYDPNQGSIFVDNKNLRDLSIKSLRKNIGFVIQENVLFQDTIINNIRFANPGASRSEVINAAKRAQAHAFIKSLPKGYDTVVGHRGVKLSGGEKQRIVIARVLLKDPPILVLDEATSSLDSKIEHQLQKALKEVMKNRTTIIIAHRLSTIMAAEQILVFDKGRLVEKGRHASLIRRSQIYKELWRLQVGGYIS